MDWPFDFKEHEFIYINNYKGYLEFCKGNRPCKMCGNMTEYAFSCEFASSFTRYNRYSAYVNYGYWPLCSQNCLNFFALSEM